MRAIQQSCLSGSTCLSCRPPKLPQLTWHAPERLHWQSCLRECAQHLALHHTPCNTQPSHNNGHRTSLREAPPAPSFDMKARATPGVGVREAIAIATPQSLPGQARGYQVQLRVWFSYNAALATADSRFNRWRRPCSQHILHAPACLGGCLHTRRQGAHGSTA